jgi:glucose/arabinose dehydrogenase
VINSQGLLKSRLAFAPVLLGAALALAACSSSGSSSPAASQPSSTAPASAPASSTPAPGSVSSVTPVTGSPSASPGQASPAWQSALGFGVVVYAPKSETPGSGDPGQAVEGLLKAVASKDLANECTYMDPRTASTCKSQASQAQAAQGNQLPYFSNAKIGYTVIYGNEALVGTTGTFCDPTQSPACFTNTDPAAIFSAADKTFTQLWNDAISSNSGNTYSLVPADEINGKWYIYES